MRVTENKYIRGDWWIIEDLGGQKYRRSECVFVKEPGNRLNGLMVHRSDYAPRNPQLDVRGVRDNITVQHGRPRQDAVLVADAPGPFDPTSK